MLQRLFDKNLLQLQCYYFPNKEINYNFYTKKAGLIDYFLNLLQYTMLRYAVYSAALSNTNSGTILFIGL